MDIGRPSDSAHSKLPRGVFFDVDAGPVGVVRGLEGHVSAGDTPGADVAQRRPLWPGEETADQRVRDSTSRTERRQALLSEQHDHPNLCAAEVRASGAQMLDRLQDGYARERAFVDDAAHELRTPLTMLRGELELAGTRPRSPAELEATLQSARMQTARLVALANDLLTLARSADGRLPLRRERLNVQSMLDAAALRAGTRADDRPIAIAPEAGEAGLIEVDRLRIEQALDNLIANALDHGEGRVLIGAIREPEALLLTVEDEGAGVDPAVAQRAFDRFARGDAARAGSGTGLGLAIVRTIAAAHGRSAGLEPRPEGGTRAWLRIPVG